MNAPIAGRRWAAGFAAAMLFLVAAAQASAQQETLPAYRFRLLGAYDESTGSPIEGVKVSDALTGTSSMTSKEGMVRLFFLPDGGGLVRLQKLGYETQTFPVSITPSDTAPLTLLMRQVVALPTVVTTDAAPRPVSATLRGFDERARARRTGYFITDSTLRKHEDQSLADVLRTNAPGVSVTANQGTMYLAQSPRCRDGTKAGPPQLYLDGIPLASDFPPGNSRLSGATLPPFDLTPYQISNLAGIEWYPDASMIPIEFAHPSNRCGALFLWTRH